MRVVNLTRGAVLAERAELASTFIRRLVGLLGRNQLPPGGGLVLPRTSAVHSLGMRLELDVLYVSRELRVLRAVRLRRNRLGPLVRGTYFVVELPAGAVRASGTRVGDRLQFIP